MSSSSEEEIESTRASKRSDRFSYERTRTMAKANSMTSGKEIMGFFKSLDTRTRTKGTNERTKRTNEGTKATGKRTNERTKGT